MEVKGRLAESQLKKHLIPETSSSKLANQSAGQVPNSLLLTLAKPRNVFFGIK